jgi:hypothetical protein
MGYFQRTIGDDGWRDVVQTWVPRLMPGLVSALFHGVIRTSHAVRSLEVADTPARRAELSRAMGNWAVWFGPGQPTDATDGNGFAGDDPGTAAAQAAARAAGCYVAAPSIFVLHGVTGAMAVQLLSGYLHPSDAASAVAQLEAEHRVVLEGITPAPIGDSDGDWDVEAPERSARSFDPHQVKLVEACRRGLGLTGDARFAAAARVVTGTP